MNRDVLTTRDLAEAAYLYAIDRRMTDCTVDENGTVFFSFERPVECAVDLEEYRRKEAMVNAKEYFDAIRTLKELIWKKKEESGAGRKQRNSQLRQERI